MCPYYRWVIEKPLVIPLLVISCVRFLPLYLMMFDQSSVHERSIILHGELDVFQFLGLIRALYPVFNQPGCTGALVSALSFGIGAIQVFWSSSFTCSMNPKQPCLCQKPQVCLCVCVSIMNWPSLQNNNNPTRNKVQISVILGYMFAKITSTHQINDTVYVLPIHQRFILYG